MPEAVEGVFFLCPCLIAKRENRNLPTSKLLEKDLSVCNANKNNPIFADFLEYAVIASEYAWNRYQTDIYPGLMIADEGFTNYYQASAYSFIDEKGVISSIQFDKPVGIITARQDKCVGFKDAEALLGNFPRSTFAIIDGAGHNMQIERPNVFNCLFLDWPERIGLEHQNCI
jgi:pimeloyl-ACP methyl ester carboxylesterase